jgi:hypothetical protein
MRTGHCAIKNVDGADTAQIIFSSDRGSRFSRHTETTIICMVLFNSSVFHHPWKPYYLVFECPSISVDASTTYRPNIDGTVRLSDSDLNLLSIFEVIKLHSRAVAPNVDLCYKRGSLLSRL